jgi:hypothetical protein
MKLGGLRKGPLNPNPILVPTIRSAMHTQRVCNQAPHILSSGAIKKQMLTTLIFIKKTQELDPFHLRLTKLSLVRITFWETSHIKIFIFRGILAFQIILKLGPKS